MSEEVLATARILEITTRAGVEIIKLGAHCSIASYRKLRDLYHAHILDEAGEMTYGKLLRHVGSDTQILNFETEDKEVISRLKEGMTDYKISFVSMPDLKTGDGCTQFMVDASDASKVNAFLKRITKLTGYTYMTPDGYTATGTKEQWNDIHKKAVSEKAKERGREPESPKEPTKEPAKETDRSSGRKTSPGVPVRMMPAGRIEELHSTQKELTEFCRDENYRSAYHEEGAMRVVFSPKETVLETPGSVTFRLPDEDGAVSAGGKVFSVPRDHVHKERGRYAAILIPGKEYTILPASGRITRSGTDIPVVSHIQGNELIQRFSNRSMRRTGQTAAALAKDFSGHAMDKKELVRM